MYSLNKLEQGAGIKVVSTLRERLNDVITIAEISLDSSERSKVSGSSPATKESLELVVDIWVAGRSGLSPTNRSLILVFDKLGRNEIRDQLRQHFDDTSDTGMLLVKFNPSFLCIQEPDSSVGPLPFDPHSSYCHRTN